MLLLNKSHLERLYEFQAKKSHCLVRLTKSILESSLKYAKRKQFVNIDASIGAKLPNSYQNPEYKISRINTKKTLSMEQLQILIKASKNTSIYLQVLFSALMGLRKSEVNGLKYSDIDFVKRTIKIQRQLGVVSNSNKEDFVKKTYTKQEIPLKTFSSNRELDIPDVVFEAILEQKKKYEKDKHRRKNDKTNPFQDLGYICCSSYGRPRSRYYNFPHFKKLLKENNLPDIRWHDLRATYATLLLKNNFNLKAVSKKLGHSKQIITADVYVDKKEIVADCIKEITPFINDVLPKEKDISIKNYEELSNEMNENIINNLIEEVTSNCDIKLKDYTNSDLEVNILNNYWKALNI